MRCPGADAIHMVFSVVTSAVMSLLATVLSVIAPAFPPTMAPAVAAAGPAAHQAARVEARVAQRSERAAEARRAAAKRQTTSATKKHRATRAGDTNPFTGRPWASYGGPAEMAWAPYVNATGEKKAALAKIALTPKAKWFGGWIPTRDIASKVREYVTNAQAGDPTALVQFTVFRMSPWEHDACKRLPTRAEARDYKAWTDNFAAAVGDTPSAIVLQPDGPFALCAPGGSKKPSRLIAYSAKALSSLPNTAVYIEAGSADWPHPAQGGVNAALRILIPAGIRARPRGRPQRHPLLRHHRRGPPGSRHRERPRRTRHHRQEGRRQHLLQRSPVPVRHLHRS